MDINIFSSLEKIYINNIDYCLFNTFNGSYVLDSSSGPVSGSVDGLEVFKEKVKQIEINKKGFFLFDKNKNICNVFLL